MLISAGLGAALADSTEKKGTTPYVTHFIFRPVQSLEVPGLGTATLLEALGTTQNMKGEKMFDKMSVRRVSASLRTRKPSNGGTPTSLRCHWSAAQITANGPTS
jgi:hypothetical protein